MSTFSAHEQNSIFISHEYLYMYRLSKNVCTSVWQLFKSSFWELLRARLKIPTRVRDTAPRAALSRAQDAPAALGLEYEPARPHRDRLLARDRGPFRRGERASTGCLIRAFARFP